MTMTYKKEINDIANNDVVLNIAGKIAEILQVPYARVTDAYGGFFGNPSANLGTPAKKANGTAGNGTANATNATRML